MATLKPIRIILKRRVHASGAKSVYPDFPSYFATNPEVFNGVRPGKFFTVHGAGLHLNKQENLGTGAANGEAVTLIPKASADALLAQFPADVFPLTEAELETFWDTKAHAHEQAELEDISVIQAIAAKRSLGMRETAQDLAALDPDNLTQGILKNHNKTWADYKAKADITVEQ